MVSHGEVAADRDVLPLLQDLGRRGVRFYLEQGTLKSAGTGELTRADVDFVRRRKPEIIAHLLSQAAQIGDADGADGPAPLSYQQERLWLLNEIAERSEEYNSVETYCIRGDLDHDRLVTALRRVVRENGVLRTVYRMAGDAVSQVVLDTDLHIVRDDVATAEEALSQARSAQLAESGHQFDLSADIPVRCRLIAAPDVCYVILNMHHIACDGWSMPLIWQELSRFYDANAQGTGVERTGAAYADYARWQRQTITGDVLDTLVDSWRARLDGAPLVHGLPVDGGGRDTPGQVAGIHARRVAGDVYDAFTKRCVAAGANEFAGLHSLLAILVAIVSGRPETVVGSPIANRELRDIQETVGFFVNMISVRGAVDQDDAFADVLAVKMAEIEFGYAFQQVPFERVVEAVTDGRNDRSPIFQIILALQNFGAAGPSLEGTQIDVLPDVQARSRYDLEVFVKDDGSGGRELLWVYDESLFDEATIERWARWFSRMLEIVSESVEVSVADLRASLAERVPQTIVRGDDGPADMAEPIDVLERIAATAEADPDRVAVGDGVRQQTYGELMRRAGEIGGALAERYGRGGVYAVDMDRSIELVQTIVGIMSVGGTYVVVDPDDSAARRSMVVEAAQTRCLLTSGEPGPLDETAAPDIIDVRTLTAAGLDSQGPVSADDDLYYVFTSGSTGRPKGVRVTYRNLAAYLGGVVARLRLRPGARYCWQSSVATDFGNTVLFGALATGGRLDIATRDDILDGAALGGFLRRHDTDVLKITPSHLAALLETHPIADLVPRTTLVLGGEAAPPSVIQALSDVPASVAVHNHYGPSETTIGVFVADVTDPAASGALPIGRPLPAAEFTIETADGAPVPFGAAGELVIRGAQVAAGYLGEPDDGSTAFFATSTGRGYRTGDWVRQRNDGQVVFLGRRDDQVKIRGYRVELGEIRAALEATAGVGRAEVLVEEDSQGTNRVVAFVRRDASADRAVDDDARTRIDAEAVVDQWREVYDFAYTERVSGDIEFNASGWISSYTGEQIPEEQMRSWLSSTLERISAVQPKSVLEIGCGLGIIAYPLSRQVDSYLACDFSAQIIAMNERNAQKISTGPLSFFTCEAIDIDQYVERIRGAAVDTVIINSVVQYFPGLDYLEEVLDKVLAIECVRTVFVGDVRNHDLLDEFSLSVVDAHATDGETQPGPDRLQQAYAQSEKVTELLISDEYWTRFAAQRESVAGVSVLPRIGQVSNELFDFRYDVILSKDSATLYQAGSAGPVEVRDADLAETDGLWQSLAGGETGTVVVRGVRNPQTAGHCEALRVAKSGVAVGSAAVKPVGPDPALEVLTRLESVAAAHGLRTSAHYARDESGAVSCLDLVLFRADGALYADMTGLAVPSKERTAPLSTTPTAVQPGDVLVSRIAEEVAAVLPPHMRPDQIVPVSAFPLGKSGKLDRHALLLLASRQESAGGLGELVGETETRLAEILRELLGSSERIDRDSDFFAIGGHSLLAARYVHAVNRAFGLELRAKSVFDRPRLRDFAELVAASQEQAEPVVVPGDTGSEKMAISPLQQRFWTIAKSSGPSTLYNTTLLLELTGPVSVSALRTAFHQVVAHHQVLRSYFEEEGDTVFIRLRDASDLMLSHMEIPGLSAERAERLLMERINRPFDLETGPLVEAALVTAAPETHYLMLCIHHIITDGAAEAILIQDLQECYEACLQGREPRWRDDGAAFFRYLARTEWPGTESLEFWAGQLDGAPLRHSLPLDGDRATQSVHDGESLRSDLSEAATAALADLARRHHTTMFVVLNAVVGLFFSFLSGEDDVVIGAPYDCRETEADGAAMGMYVNTVPFRHRIDWSQTLDSLIVAEWEYYREAFAHRHVPFDRLVEHINPERISGMNPLLQIVLALHPEGRSVFPFHDCQARPIKAATVESKFDLLFNSQVIDDRLAIYWEYKKSLFSAQRVETMAELFGSFVETAVGNPAVPVGRLDFGARADGEASRALMSGPTVPLTDQSYLDAFARAVAAAPERLAVRVAEREGVDYRSLDARSDALAALLRDKGVRKGDLVAVCLKRSTEFLVTMLAVNKAGAAYVPMDSEYLRKNAPALLREHSITFAVVEDTDSRTYPEAVTVVRRQEIPLTGTAEQGERAELQHSDLCYVIFTSGSTGKPKGVAVTHGSVVNYLAHCTATYLDRDPRVAVLSSPHSFDATVTTTLFALAAGLTLHVIEEDNEISGLHQILTAQHSERLLLKLTPSHLVALSNLGVTQQPSDAQHVFVIGGEDLKAAVMAPWYRAFGQSQFFNEYGPTEATVGCIVHEVTDRDIRTGSVPIGTPICNTTIAVVHRGMVCVPYQRGEIVIMGAGLARGYLDGDQTAAAFRAVPSMAGAVGYHTGDVASLIGSQFRYHGRGDGDIKIRGFRVSLAEIEAVIGGVDGVVDCACAISEDGQRLSAYVVPAASGPRTWETDTELRNALRQLLPRYMVPDTITLLADLPLTAHGKVDLDRLTAGREAAVEQDESTEQPDEILGRLSAIWRNVLGVSGELPTDSSFFSLGGNSLLVTLLLMRMNEEFDAGVTLDVLYRHATLSEQCALLTPDPATAAAPDVPATTGATGATAPSDPGEVGLTAAQRRFYFQEKLGSGSDHAISLCFHIGEGVDADHLRGALIALMDRHPILKSRVAQRSGLPVLVPGEATDSRDRVVVIPCGDAEESLERILARQDSALNLFTDPLGKAFIHVLPDGSADLQIIVHHIVFDDWSEKILLADLTRLYAEISATGKAEPGHTVPFQRYAVAQAGDSEVAKANTQWWIEALTGAPTAHGLPKTENRAAAGEPAGVLELVIEQETLGRLDDECRRLGVTRFNAVHSALALAVCSVGSEPEAVIGVPVTNRDDATYRETIGLFMETLPLRTVVGGGDDSFRQIVQDSHARFADALGRTDFRVEEVMNARAAERAGNSRALYEIMLTLHDEGGISIDFAGVGAERVLMPRREAKLDLIVDVKPVSGRLHTYWEYDTAVLAEATVRSLLDEFESWLVWGLTRADEPVRARGALRGER